MSRLILIVLFLLVIGACSREEPADGAPAEDIAEKTAMSQKSIAKKTQQATGEIVEDITATVEKAGIELDETMESIEAMTPETIEETTQAIGVAETVATATATSTPTPNHDEMVALAKSKGCFACHAIDKKLVGPAWSDIAERYRSNAGARGTLIEFIKNGGKGNWVDLTGGAPMPPYGRIGEENIEKLTDFILSLK